MPAVQCCTPLPGNGAAKHCADPVSSETFDARPARAASKARDLPSVHNRKTISQNKSTSRPGENRTQELARRHAPPARPTRPSAPSLQAVRDRCPFFKDPRCLLGPYGRTRGSPGTRRPLRYRRHRHSPLTRESSNTAAGHAPRGGGADVEEREEDGDERVVQLDPRARRSRPLDATAAPPRHHVEGAARGGGGRKAEPQTKRGAFFASLPIGGPAEPAAAAAGWLSKHSRSRVYCQLSEITRGGTQQRGAPPAATPSTVGCFGQPGVRPLRDVPGGSSQPASARDAAVFKKPRRKVFRTAAGVSFHDDDDDAGAVSVSYRPRETGPHAARAGWHRAPCETDSQSAPGTITASSASVTLGSGALVAGSPGSPRRRRADQVSR